MARCPEPYEREDRRDRQSSRFWKGFVEGLGQGLGLIAGAALGMVLIALAIPQ